MRLPVPLVVRRWSVLCRPCLVKHRSFTEGNTGDVFQQLRVLTQPCDGQQLARLAAAATDSARHGVLTSKQAALLAYRLEAVGWFSIDVCEALASSAERFVEDLTVAEWLVILRYFAAAGFTHPNFSAAAAQWLSGSAEDVGGSGQLQLPQLQELVATLASTGHLSGPAAEAVVRALTHLPPEPDTGTLVKLTACLAAADAGEPAFYQNVVASVSKLKTGSTSWAPVVEELDSSDFWRLSVLFLLAKADIVRWPLVLNILRKLDPRVARMGLPGSLVPRICRQLRLAASENEAILLEVRPLALELARAAATALSGFRSPQAADVATGLGFLGAIDNQLAEALWKHVAESSTAPNGTAEEAGHGSIRARCLLQTAWAALVARCMEPHQDMQLPGFGDMLSLLPDAQLGTADRILMQQARQVALCMASANVKIAQKERTTFSQPFGRAFFTRHRQSDQVRIGKAFVARLRELGVYCREIPGWKAVPAGFGEMAEKEARPQAGRAGKGGRRSLWRQRQQPKGTEAPVAARDTFVVVYTPERDGVREKKLRQA
ncbi:unnamed protein product [Symbiodinium sp. CCMP2592]|nr:unnamed protein product [Symbiodinium sp. CCMP2592]